MRSRSVVLLALAAALLVLPGLAYAQKGGKTNPPPPPPPPPAITYKLRIIDGIEGRPKSMNALGDIVANGALKVYLNGVVRHKDELLCEEDAKEWEIIWLYAINSSQVIGVRARYIGQDESLRPGFSHMGLLDTKTGRFERLFRSGTVIDDINEFGEICGTHRIGDEIRRAWKFSPGDTAPTYIAPEFDGIRHVNSRKINDAGQVLAEVGLRDMAYRYTPNGDPLVLGPLAVVKNTRSGNYPTSMNSFGDIVGQATAKGGWYPYRYTDETGMKAIATWVGNAFAINDGGDILYQDTTLFYTKGMSDYYVLLEEPGGAVSVHLRDSQVIEVDPADSALWTEFKPILTDLKNDRTILGYIHITDQVLGPVFVLEPKE
jgi:hypothetical protein